MPGPAGQRHYGLDWLRIGAFGLLILYHSALGFGPAPWLVRVDRPVFAVDLILAAVQPWRMALLFVVSGYATQALLARSGGVSAFLKARAARLLPPLFAGTLFLAAPETWVGLVENHGYSAGFGRFFANDWLSFRSLGGTTLPNPEHLWFVSYLLTYTLVLAGLLALAPRLPVGRRAAALAERWAGRPRLLWLALLPLLLVRLALLFTVPEQRGVLHDWVSDVLFVPAFFFGFALAARPGLWKSVSAARRAALPVALGSLAAILAAEWLYPGHPPHLVQALDRSAQFAMQWSMIVLLLAFADRHLNRDAPLRRRLNEAVFPLYLVHQTIIVLLLWRLKETGLPYLGLYAILVASTAAGGWLFYEVGRRSGPLRPIFALAPNAPGRPARPARPAIATANGSS